MDGDVRGDLGHIRDAVIELCKRLLARESDSTARMGHRGRGPRQQLPWIRCCWRGGLGGSASVFGVFEIFCCSWMGGRGLDTRKRRRSGRWGKIEWRTRTLLCEPCVGVVPPQNENKAAPAKRHTHAHTGFLCIGHRVHRQPPSEGGSPAVGFLILRWRDRVGFLSLQKNIMRRKVEKFHFQSQPSVRTEIGSKSSQAQTQRWQGGGRRDGLTLASSCWAFASCSSNSILRCLNTCKEKRG